MTEPVIGIDLASGPDHHHESHWVCKETADWLYDILLAILIHDNEHWLRDEEPMCEDDTWTQSDELAHLLRKAQKAVDHYHKITKEGTP